MLLSRNIFNQVKIFNRKNNNESLEPNTPVYFMVEI